MHPTPRTLFLGITGASGTLYGLRTLQGCVQAGLTVDLCLTDAARRVLLEESGFDWDGESVAPLLLPGQDCSRVRVHPPTDIGAPPASGSALGEVVVLAPCSLNTLARVARGSAERLVERAAQVALKEKRTLVLVPRETPLSALHLDNLSRLAWAGATILPACPPLYNRPTSLEELVDGLVGKILDAARVPQTRLAPWSGGAGVS